MPEETLEQIARDCYGKRNLLLSFQSETEVDGKQIKYCSITVHNPKKFCVAHRGTIKMKVPYKRGMQTVYICTRED